MEIDGIIKQNLEIIGWNFSSRLPFNHTQQFATLLLTSNFLGINWSLVLISVHI